MHFELSEPDPVDTKAAQQAITARQAGSLEFIRSDDLPGLIDAAYERARQLKETHDHNIWGAANNIQDFLRRCQNVISLVGRGSGRF